MSKKNAPKVVAQSQSELSIDQATDDNNPTSEATTMTLLYTTAPVELDTFGVKQLRVIGVTSEKTYRSVLCPPHSVDFYRKACGKAMCVAYDEAEWNELASQAFFQKKFEEMNDYHLPALATEQPASQPRLSVVRQPGLNTPTNDSEPIVPTVQSTPDSGIAPHSTAMVDTAVLNTPTLVMSPEPRVLTGIIATPTLKAVVEKQQQANQEIDSLAAELKALQDKLKAAQALKKEADKQAKEAEKAEIARLLAEREAVKLATDNPLFAHHELRKAIMQGGYAALAAMAQAIEDGVIRLSKPKKASAESTSDTSTPKTPKAPKVATPRSSGTGNSKGRYVITDVTGRGGCRVRDSLTQEFMSDIMYWHAAKTIRNELNAKLAEQEQSA